MSRSAGQRLPIEMVSALARHSAKLLGEHSQSGWRWRPLASEQAKLTALIAANAVT